jgi:hypothetical protein
LGLPPRGVGIAARRLIAKRQDEAPATVADTGPEDVAKANVDFALAEQQHAMRMFPESKSVGEALAKWHATDSGRKVQSAYLRDAYEKMQKRGGDVPKVRHAEPVDWNDDKQATAAYRKEKASYLEQHEAGRTNQSRRRMTAGNLNDSGGEDTR